MGLAIVTGHLADLVRIGETEGVAYFEATLATVNRLLAAEGLPAHVEPRTEPPASRCSVGSFPYSTLHYLRRAYAHRADDPEWVATPLADGEDPTTDDVLEEQASMLDSHLLCHSDCEGWYVPVGFGEVIFDEGNELPGGMLGSTQRLREELAQVAPALDISLDANDQLSDAEAARLDEIAGGDHPLWRELTAWFALWEATRISLASRCAIVFC